MRYLQEKTNRNKKPFYSRRRLKKKGIILVDRIGYMEVQIPTDDFLHAKSYMRIISSIRSKKNISAVIKGFVGSVSAWNQLNN